MLAIHARGRGGAVQHELTAVHKCENEAAFRKTWIPVKYLLVLAEHDMTVRQWSERLEPLKDLREKFYNQSLFKPNLNLVEIFMHTRSNTLFAAHARDIASTTFAHPAILIKQSLVKQALAGPSASARH